MYFRSIPTEIWNCNNARYAIASNAKKNCINVKYEENFELYIVHATVDKYRAILNIYSMRNSSHW